MKEAGYVRSSEPLEDSEKQLLTLLKSRITRMATLVLLSHISYSGRDCELEFGTKGGGIRFVAQFTEQTAFTQHKELIRSHGDFASV